MIEDDGTENSIVSLSVCETVSNSLSNKNILYFRENVPMFEDIPHLPKT